MVDVRYTEEMTRPQKNELQRAGFELIETVDDVKHYMDNMKGITLVYVNSICGCAKGIAVPTVKQVAGYTSRKPDTLLTVFAGVDNEATKEVRKRIVGVPPSSPFIAIFKDSKLEFYQERHHIMNNTPFYLVETLTQTIKTLRMSERCCG